MRERMYREAGGGRNLGGRKGCKERKLELLELGVAFYEFFCAAAWEGYGETTVVVVAFDPDDGAYAVLRVANFLAEQWIGVCAASNCGAAEAWRRAGTLGLVCGWHGTAAHAAQEFVGRVGVFGIGLVAAGLADFGHRAAHGVH